MVIKSTFHIPRMDCPSEEALINMKLSEVSGIKSMSFDLENRTLEVFHSCESKTIDDSLSSLKLGSVLISSTEVDFQKGDAESDQRSILKVVLAINLGFFFIEMLAGWFAGSMGLVADSLDMLADATVYGLSLFAVGKIVTTKKKVATVAGIFQALLAVLGFGEVLRRFFFVEGMPDFRTMIIVSLFALLANAVCLILLRRSKGKNEAHLRASMIFTSNDIIINLGVIFAGLLVFLTRSRIPDLIIGSIVFIIVIVGAIRIFRLGR